MSSYSNFYNSFQYGSNNGGKQNLNDNYAGTRQPIQPPPPHGYMEATYSWNNQGASSTTGFNNQSLNNPRINTNNSGLYSSSHDYPSHSGDLSNSLNTYNNNQVAQAQEDKLQSSGLNSLVYASALESAIRKAPDQPGYNSSRQDGRGSYQGPGRTVSQSYSPQTSNDASAASGKTGSYDPRSQRPGFVPQSNTASNGHPARQTPNNDKSQMSQQQRNPPPRETPQTQPQQWPSNQRTPPLPHSMANMISTQSHTHAPFSSDQSAQNKNLLRFPNNSQTTPASIAHGHTGGHENRPGTPPQTSSAETAGSHQISPPKVQFINPSELYNQQYLIAQERARAAEAEAAAERQRQEEEAKAQAEAAAAATAAKDNTTRDGATPTKKNPAKRRAPKKKASDKAPAPELEAQEGGDDVAAEMQMMLEKLKGMRAKDPSLFSRLWDDIKKAPAASQQTPTEGQQNPSAAGTATEADSIMANETPKSASKKKGIPQNHMIDGMPDLGRFPAQRRRRKGKNEEGGTALATEVNVNSMLNQGPYSFSAVEQLEPGPALDNQTGSTSTQTATQDATWPASTQQRLASAASEYLAQNPTNLEKEYSPEALMLLLRNNPSYPDLCVQLELRGFILDRQALARYLLAAVPALASGNNASQEGKKAEPNGQPPASVPTLTQPIQQQAPQPLRPGATAPAKPKAKPKPRPKKTPQVSRPPPLEHPPQPPRAESLVWDGNSGPTSSMPLESGKSAPPKNKASSSRRKPAVPIAPLPPVLGPKAEKAKKRLFSEIVDLSQLSSDEEDMNELSEDESFRRLSKLPRLEGPSVERQLDHTFDQDRMNIDTTSPPPFEGQRSGSPAIGDSNVAEPDLEDFDPDDEQCLREIKNFPRISKVLEPSAALQRVYYNPKTAARDILIAAGRHPSERPLNYHLAKFPEIFAGVGSKSDLESFRWDLVDPGGPPMPEVPVEEILAEPPRVPRKRRRDKKSRADTGDDKSGPTTDSLNNADSLPSDPLLPHSSSFSTPQTPRTSMAGTPASGKGSGRRGRPPGAKNKNPTKTAIKAAAAGSLSARSAAAAPVRQAVPEPLYPVFTCQWASCPAQLHDVHTLERHVDKFHVDGQTSCQWNGCPNTSTQYVGDGLGEHVHQAHIQPLAWKYGDGPAVKATVTELDRYLNANGSIITPDASTAGESDSLIYPVESKSSIKAFYKVHEIEKPDDQAQEVLLAVRRRQQRVGVGLEQEGCEFSNPKRNKAMVNDEEFYQVVSEEEGEEEEYGDSWFQQDDSP